MAQGLAPRGLPSPCESLALNHVCPHGVFPPWKFCLYHGPDSARFGATVDTCSRWGLLLPYVSECRVLGYSMLPTPFLGPRRAQCPLWSCLWHGLACQPWPPTSSTASPTARLWVHCICCGGGFERPVVACSPLRPCLVHLPYRYAPTHGICIGQASVPGPVGQTTLHSFFARQQSPSVNSPGFTCDPAAADSTFLLAVVNPTSVLNKSRSLLKLGAEVLLLAETSAVTKVQTLVGAEMRRHVVWQR